MTRRERFIKRNNHVRGLYDGLKRKNPKWRNDAIIEEVAKKAFLSVRTIEAIIYREGIYNEVPIKPYQNPNQVVMFD
jgi:hypothetical protein